MLSKAQVEELARTGQWFHQNGCTRTIGPRGGIRESIVQVRPSGKCQLWKTRPEDYRMPFKYGMYQSGEVTPRYAADFHTVADCPLTLQPEGNVK